MCKNNMNFVCVFGRGTQGQFSSWMCRSVLFVTKWIYSSSYVTDTRGHSGERKKKYTMLLAKAPMERDSGANALGTSKDVCS